MNYYKEFEFAKRIAVVAYKKIVCRTSYNVIEKADRSLVTEVDTAVEDYIVGEIKKMFGNDSFITEERNPGNKVSGRTWVIDPIDGTVAFIKGLPTWGIQIAFVDNDITQFSIIYLPKLNELVSGYRGKGVYVNGKKLPNNADGRMSEAVVEYCGRMGIKEGTVGKVYRAIDDTVKNQFAFGSASCSFVNVITGRCDAMISGCKAPWDIYAGEFMADERGVSKYKSKLGITIYANSTELFQKLKTICKTLEKENE